MPLRVAAKAAPAALVGLAVGALGGPRARCADIQTSESVFGRQAQGVSLGAWTSNGLTWLGCDNSGCQPSTFFCTDFSGGLSFGTSASADALRACHGVTSLSRCSAASKSASGCCIEPGGLCNAPNTAESASALCVDLGYPYGDIETVQSDTCPEVNFQTGRGWESDFVNSDGYGKVFTCSIGATVPTTTTAVAAAATTTTAAATTTTDATTTTTAPTLIDVPAAPGAFTATATTSTATTSTATTSTATSSTATSSTASTSTLSTFTVTSTTTNSTGSAGLSEEDLTWVIIAASVGALLLLCCMGACLALACRQKRRRAARRSRAPPKLLPRQPETPVPIPVPTPAPPHTPTAPPESEWGVQLVKDAGILDELRRIWAAARPQDIGRGYDDREPGLSVAKLSVLHAWRIEADNLAHMYTTREDTLRKEVKQLTAAKVLPIGAPGRITTKLDDLLPFAPADPTRAEHVSLPEVCLLHGSRPEHLMSILKRGFGERLCEGLFGCGVYLAEDAAKVDQTCVGLDRPDSILDRELFEKCGVRRQEGEICFAIVCKVVLGVSMHTRGDTATTSGGTPTDLLGRAPFAGAEHRGVDVIPGTQPPMSYHSLVAEQGAVLEQSREFVVYSSTAVLPWLLVGYVRHVQV